MSDYSQLEEPIGAREAIILDGAIGAQLQSMGAALADFAWGGPSPELTCVRKQLILFQRRRTGGAERIALGAKQ